MSMSLRLLNRVQPCIQRQSQKTTINSMNNINIIRSKSSKSTSNSNSNSGILRKASMALGKQKNSGNSPTTSTANVTVNEKLTNNRHKLRREPVLKVTPAATATVDQYEEAMQGQLDPQQQMMQSQTPGSGSGSVPTYTEMQQAYTSPPPPPAPPVVPEPPSPSTFSRTEFHQGHLHEFAPRIVVVGVGGGGGNAVNNMIANQLSGKLI